MAYAKNNNLRQIKKQNATLPLSPTFHQQIIKILNMVICPGIQYTFYICHLSPPQTSAKWTYFSSTLQKLCVTSPLTPPTFTQLPCETFGIEVFSLLPIYATTFSGHLTQILNGLVQLGQIYQELVKFIVTKHRGPEHLPHLKHRTCIKSPVAHTFILKEKL